MSSLRALVEKWLAPGPGSSLRITRFNCPAGDRRRHVQVETCRPDGAVTILFFRHRDGVWHVFPPGPDRLSMQAYPGDGRPDAI